VERIHDTGARNMARVRETVLPTCATAPFRKVPDVARSFRRAR
jgi:hypothetical protein